MRTTIPVLERKLEWEILFLLLNITLLDSEVHDNVNL